MKTIRSGGPCRYTLVDGQAAMAMEASDIKDLDGGKVAGRWREEVVFRELDDRFPDRVAADRSNGGAQ